MILLTNYLHRKYW